MPGCSTIARPDVAEAAPDDGVSAAGHGSSSAVGTAGRASDAMLRDR